MTLHRITTKALLRSLPTTKIDTILTLLRVSPLVHRDDLIDALWGDDEDGGPEYADDTLRQYISRLRHRDGHKIVNHHARGYELQRNSVPETTHGA